MKPAMHYFAINTPEGEPQLYALVDVLRIESVLPGEAEQNGRRFEVSQITTRSGTRIFVEDTMTEIEQRIEYEQARQAGSVQ